MAEEAISVFLSYSHHDAEMLTALKKHLAGLKRTNKIKTWDDRAIGAGNEWEPTIQEKLNTADIIILLISADFIASDYCYCNELQRAIERHDAGEAHVIPVILKPCLWNDTDIPFSKLNVLPNRALAITKWEDAAEAYTNVAQGISSAVASLRKQKLEKLNVVDSKSDTLTNQPSVLLPSDDCLIEQVREHCCQKVLNRHSRMRLLDGREIGVDQLYVDVWLLEKPEYKNFNTKESLIKTFDREKDRLALGKRIQRNSGFEIANSDPKLVILGKPGSGKTTFLKHLFFDWCKGEFQPGKIAVLIELRRIRGQGKKQKWDLVDAIGQELELGKESISDLLESGKLLVLLDGLDEVPTDELRRKVESQVEQFSYQYSDENRFILTCRTQIMKAVPSGFTSVEVADFNSEQVKKFVQKWLTAGGQSESEVNSQWEKIQCAITSQPDLREITATPMLLSLICVVWQDSGEVPTNRANLYRRAISWLLNRWNDEKNIKDWEVGTKAYRKLSIKDKEALLTEIAARKFENPKNFVLFEQDELAKQISQKLQLANVQKGLAVLKAIEAQHGLLIERADELWSFSHLTFQEYFTVQWLTMLSPQQLAEKIANQQWQKSVEQLMKSQQPADRLLRLIKQATDQLIANDSAIQDFLGWLLQKSVLSQTNYKPAAIRAFYYSITRACVLTLDRTLEHALDRSLSLDLNRILEDMRALRPPSLTHVHGGPEHALDLLYSRTLHHACAFDIGHVLIHDRALDLERALNLALKLSPESIAPLLHKLEEDLPMLTQSNKIQCWWPLHGTQWIKQLRHVMNKYRNIGHDWKFTESQQQQLQRYYEANKFLVSLINIEGAASEECRTEIEYGLLLPWGELQRHLPYLYEDLKE